jgi:hypothetical protein
VVGEADYLFPLPANAAFQDLKLSINGELVSGETMNAGQARGIYEAIVRAQRDPALVEWMGHGLLRARIFPINLAKRSASSCAFRASRRAKETRFASTTSAAARRERPTYATTAATRSR